MKIIILGAGQVGSSVAYNLATEANDITIVDTNHEILRDLRDRLDIRTIHGIGSHPEVLRNAGAEDADMILAVTNSDEVNMVACQIAYSIFHTPTKIARVRSGAYLREDSLFHHEALPVDVLISPETIVKNYISRLIENPGTLQVLDFADGLVRLVAVRAYFGGPLVGKELKQLRNHIPNVDTRVAAIYRRNRAIMPTGETVVEPDDEVFFIAAKNDIRAVMSELRRLDKPNKRIMLVGGGNIGKNLAKELEKSFQVKLIEKNRTQVRHLSEKLNNTIVLQGDGADKELLLEENIDDMDVFIALTNDDEANILSSMLAKRLGARKVMSIINRPAYVDLVENGIIDIAISPHMVTIGALLTHVRRGDIVAVHSLRRGMAEAIEAVAHGDSRTSKVIGHQLDEIPLPYGTTVGAIVRNGKVLIAHHDLVIEAEDHVILFLIDKHQIPAVEQLFQVKIGFF